MTLLAMDEPIYRVNGGIGFAIDFDNLEIEASRSNKVVLEDHRKTTLDTFEIDRVKELIEKVALAHAFSYRVQISIKRGASPHSGFGCGTTLALACLEALCLLNDEPVTAEQLISLSNRGGTSGIGIQTYFHGGFVFDIGQRFLGQRHASSRINEIRKSPALTVLKAPMPDWQIGICIPDAKLSKSAGTEQFLFDSICPISFEDAAKSAYHSIFGIVGSVMESDYHVFCRATNNLQLLRWKAAEIKAQHPDIKIILDALMECSDAVGMSSMGPAIYFFTRDFDRTQEKMMACKIPFEIRKGKVNNCGRSVTYD